MAVQASGTKTEQLMAKRDAFVARGVALAPIVADHGHGARLTDVDGKEYIDFAGGIVDIEFLVQMFQLKYGRDEPTLRVPNTLAALAALLKAGHL